MCALEKPSRRLCWNGALDIVVEKSWKPLAWCTGAVKQSRDACLTKGETTGEWQDGCVRSFWTLPLVFFFCRGACLVGTMPQEKGHIKKTSQRVTKAVLKWTLALK